MQKPNLDKENIGRILQFLKTKKIISYNGTNWIFQKDFERHIKDSYISSRDFIEKDKLLNNRISRLILISLMTWKEYDIFTMNEIWEQSEVILAIFKEILSNLVCN